MYSRFPLRGYALQLKPERECIGVSSDRNAGRAEGGNLRRPRATHEVRSERALSEQVGLYPRAANTRCSASVIQNVVTSTVADHIAILEEIQPSHK